MTTTSPVNLMMATIDPAALASWMSHSNTRDRDNAIHRILTETLGKLAPKPHRAFFPNNPAQAATLYGYTRADAQDLRQQAQACATPLQTAVLPIQSIMTKPMPDNWREGESFGFDIRLRPILRIRSTPPPPLLSQQTPSRSRRYREVDAYLHHARLRRSNNLPVLPPPDVYIQWLADLFRRQGGARLVEDSAQLRALRHTPTNHKTPGPITGPDIIVQGAITVADPKAFRDLIANGTGRHKTYGYGMLLIRALSS